MSAGPAVQHVARRHGWWFAAAVVVPLLCGFAARWLIFHLFGNGSYIAAGTFGYGLIDWWDRGDGRFLVAGLLGGAVVLVTRRNPVLAVVAGVLAAAMTFVLELVGLVIYVSQHPGALD